MSRSSTQPAVAARFESIGGMGRWDQTPRRATSSSPMQIPTGIGRTRIHRLFASLRKRSSVSPTTMAVEIEPCSNRLEPLVVVASIGRPWMPMSVTAAASHALLMVGWIRLAMATTTALASAAGSASSCASWA